jgi:hypothetical protein
MSTRYISCADTAKLVRAALKKEWPTIKFSVRSDTYAGGASIDIKWTDGPTDAMVGRVTSKFAGATFDGMIDLKSHHDSILNGEAVSFGADFVHRTRQFSPSVYESVARRTCAYWGVDFPGMVVKPWGTELAADPRVQGPDEWLSTLIYRESRDLAVSSDGALVPVRLKYKEAE